MTNVLKELKYNKSHEWVRQESDGVVVVGISDHAQALLGDLVYVELPELDTDFDVGEECGVVESVKAASDIYSPVSGKVVAVNEELNDAPQQINIHPYEDGWIFKLQLAEGETLDNLLNAEQYEELLKEDD